MLKDDLKCVLIGRDINIYHDLAKLVRKIDASSRFKQVDITAAAITKTLKKVSGPCLIFIYDEVSFSLELLSDLIWQHNPDAIVVILSKKANTVALKELFNNTQFSRLKLSRDERETSSILELLIKSAREKSDFRLCKKLLGVSEKRCQWLVDSSREAVAFISRDMHWYANTAYLNLFGITSIQKLRATTVKDLIIADEQPLFDGFKQNQKAPKNTKQSIQLSMRKLNGSSFRAKAYLIPSVFKGSKCFQLWVREINSISSIPDSNNSKQVDPEKLELDTSKANQPSASNIHIEEENPFSRLLKEDTGNEVNNLDNENSSKKSTTDTKIVKKQSIKTNKQKIYNEISLLKSILRRKEARIVVKPLSYLKDNETNKHKSIFKHNILSLKVAAAQKKGVDDLLINLPEFFSDQKRSIFWDKVKFSRMLQILIHRKQLPVNLFLRINEASIVDDSFVDWLIPGLKRLGVKSKNLTFLIPSNINENDHKKALLFIKKLRQVKCKIALDSFSLNKEALQLLRHSKPEYIRLSLPWVRQLQGNDTKEIRLSSSIRRLEANNISVIAPCGFSKDMRRLFILSGASFCQ